MNQDEIADKPSKYPIVSEGFIEKENSNKPADLQNWWKETNHLR